MSQPEAIVSGAHHDIYSHYQRAVVSKAWACSSRHNELEELVDVCSRVVVMKDAS